MTQVKSRGVKRVLNALALTEKAHYPFKNYRHAHEASVLFVGCNVVSLFPQTVRKAARMLHEAADIGLALDCCGAPLKLAGSPSEAQRVTQGVASRLRECGVTEIIVVCPTCETELRNFVDVPIVSVYAKLRELGIGKRLIPDGAIFPPCPDRHNKVWLQDVLSFFESEPPVLYRAPCCGLGERVGYRPPEKVHAMATTCIKQAKEAAIGTPFVYCASCAGSFTLHGEPNVRYVLSELLDIHEAPAVNSTFVNRLCAKCM